MFLYISKYSMESITKILFDSMLVIQYLLPYLFYNIVVNTSILNNSIEVLEYILQ